jgi:hypothetical protein
MVFLAVGCLGANSSCAFTPRYLTNGDDVLVKKLTQCRDKKQLIGFSKWKDGDGLLFGRVLEVDQKVVRFALLNPDGSSDDEVTVRVAELLRLEERPAYAERLRLFASYRPPVGQRAGQTARSRATIARHLREALKTRECVSLKLLGDPRQDCRVLGCDGGRVEYEEFGDDPFVVSSTRIVHIGQVEELRWRSTGELAVTRAWRLPAKRRNLPQRQLP